MAKTIKEIAEEIGVSKQAVYKRYKGKLSAVCAPYAYIEYGVVYLDEQGEMIIKQDFAKTNGAHTECSVCAPKKTKENAGFCEKSDKKNVQTRSEETVDIERSNGAHTERIGSTPYAKTQSDDVLQVLKVTIETLQEQLVIKDKQIERQATTIENLSASLAAAQALHAGTIQQQLAEGDEQTNDIIQSQKKGKGFLSRLFGSKN